MSGAGQITCLDARALDTVIRMQRAAGSLEVCGLVAVDQCGSQFILRLRNHAGLPGAFEVSQSEERIMRTAARQRGWQVVAFLHTHPHHAPDMSPRDFRCFERDTLPWIIIGTPVSDPVQQTYIHGSAPIQ